MKILPAVKSIKAGVLETGTRIKKASSDGYKIAGRTADIYNQNAAVRCFNITRSVSDKLVKSATLKDLPYFAGAIGLFLPIPFSSLIMFALGYMAKYTVPKLAGMYNSAANCYNRYIGKFNQDNNKSL